MNQRPTKRGSRVSGARVRLKTTCRLGCVMARWHYGFAKCQREPGEYEDCPCWLTNSLVESLATWSLSNISSKIGHRPCAVRRHVPANGMIQSITKIAKPIAPEDIRVGDYLALLEITLQYGSFNWCMADPITLPPSEPVSITWQGHFGGMPLKVKSICLPFLLVKSPHGEMASLDVRHCRLARISSEYGRVARKAFKKKKKRNGRRSSK